jgi:hypothetical protein
MIWRFLKLQTNVLKIDRETERQRDIWTDRWLDRQAIGYRQTNIQIKRTNIKMDGQTQM